MAGAAVEPKVEARVEAVAVMPAGAAVEAMVDAMVVMQAGDVVEIAAMTEVGALVVEAAVPEAGVPVGTTARMEVAAMVGAVVELVVLATAQKEAGVARAVDLEATVAGEKESAWPAVASAGAAFPVVTVIEAHRVQKVAGEMEALVLVVTPAVAKRAPHTDCTS